MLRLMSGTIMEKHQFSLLPQMVKQTNNSTFISIYYYSIKKFLLGHYEIFKILIQECESRNIDFINATDVMGMTVLHYTAMNRKPKNTQMLKILLQKDANVNSVASDNTTPLDYACATGININFLSLI